MSVALGACGVCLSGCWPAETLATFELHVTPASIADLAQNTAAIFLVSIDDVGAPAESASLTVTPSTGMAFVSSTTLASGEVAEIRLYGDDIAVGTLVMLAAEATLTDPVEAPDDRLETGIEMCDLFLPWIIAEHPELGITAATV